MVQKILKMLQKEGIFQISSLKSPMSIGQRVSCEILSNLYVENMNYLNCQLKIGKRIEKV